MKLICFTFLIILSFPLHSYGYVGPGLGLGALGVIFGVLFSVFLAFVGIFWYPIKRIIKKFRKEDPDQNDAK